MTPIRSTILNEFKKTREAGNHRSVAILFLQLAFYSLPVLPYYLFSNLSNPSVMVLVDIAAVVILVWCVFSTRIPACGRFLWIYKFFLLLIIYLPPLAISPLLIEGFPLFLGLIPIAVAGVWTGKFFDKAGFGEILVPGAAAVAYLIGLFQVVLQNAALFSLGILAYSWIARLVRRRGAEMLPRILFIPVAAMLSAIPVFSLDFYTSMHPEKASTIGAQRGVRSLGFQPVLDAYSWDFSFFFVGEQASLFFCCKDNRVLRLSKDNSLTVLETDGNHTDQAIVDIEKKEFYFIGGSILYKGSIPGGTIAPYLSMKEQYAAIGHVRDMGDFRGFPSINPRCLMIIYDTASGVIIHDLEHNVTNTIHFSNPLWDAIFHPDGTKVLSVMQEERWRLSAKARLFLNDLDGNVIRDRALDTTMIYLSPGTSDYFFLGYYFKGKLEKVSWHTLETIRSAPVDAVPRAMTYLPKWNCVMVPSYGLGTMSFLDADDLRLITKIQIGRRVRAITPSLVPDEFTISSEAGFFSIRVDEILEGHKPAGQ